MGPYMRLLVDEPDDGAPVVLRVEEGTTVGKVAELLRLVFEEAGVERVAVRVGGGVIGVCTRGNLERLLARVPRGPGDGDAARLAGSPLYTMLEFACGSCPNRVVTVHVDEDDPPACPLHGVMRGPA